MTSANIIQYLIFDKNGVEVGNHRQNIMCRINNDVLEKFTPSSDYEILPYGYDENEDYWEGDKEKLSDWLLKNKAEITNKPFNKGDIIYVKKIGNCEVIERFDIFQKGNNFTPVYDVTTERGMVVRVNQFDIIPKR